MRMRLGSVGGLAAAAALATAQAHAGDAPPGRQFNIMGPSSCAGWPKSGPITSAARAVPLNWVLGFLSGWAAHSNIALLDLVDPEQAAVWLTSYCQAHPTDTLPVAAGALQNDLEAKLPPPAPVGPPEPPMFVPPAPDAGKVVPPKPPAKKAPRKRGAAKG
jgi:hypothetical protein